LPHSKWKCLRCSRWIGRRVSPAPWFIALPVQAATFSLKCVLGPTPRRMYPDKEAGASERSGAIIVVGGAKVAEIEYRAKSE
jgi:hypothetical protein